VPGYLVAKGAHGLKFGDPIGLPGGTAVSTDGKAVVDISGGRFVFAQFVALVDHEKFLDSGVCDDARVLPLRFSPAQERTRTWASIADDCSSEQFDDWPLAPPRSVPWCLTYLKKEGRRFLALAKVEGSWWGIAEHKELCRYLRLMSLYDQLDVSNLASAESMFRRLQTIEFSYLEKIRDQQAKNAPGGRMTLEEQALFWGLSRTDSMLMIAPALLDHARAEAEKQASLAKNLRKAREEREVGRKK
jgi:hypothetical protein